MHTSLLANCECGLQNSNRCYIPEWLLKEWKIEVEIHYSLDAA